MTDDERSEWKDSEHVEEYLEKRADTLPRRAEGEATLLEELPPTARRILDLGSGDGRLLGLLLERFPRAEGVGLDFSSVMLGKAERRFRGVSRVRIVDHDLAKALPDLGVFDVICSSFAIHHLEHERKRTLFAEIFRALAEDGVFCNLEHVASPTPRLHARFFEYMANPVEDPSNKLLDVETQLGWLRESGFDDVDCLWKYRELALLVARRP